MRGRRPLPPHMKLIMGNPGKRPIEGLDSSVQADPPEMPDFLEGEAKAEWERIVPELLELGLLARVDRAQLALYCMAWARWVEAETKIAEARAQGKNPLLVMTPNGYPQLSPWVVLSNQAQAQVQRYLVEFGMSPSSRARVKPGSGQLPLFGGEGESEDDKKWKGL
jgi:P27 family predicted phage terminase small subunit